MMVTNGDLINAKLDLTMAKNINNINSLYEKISSCNKL